MRTSRRSSKLSSTPSEFTPRTASISGRDTGCLYAMMASASTTSVGVGTSWLSIGYRGLAFDDDLSEELRLLRLDATQADQLEHRQERHHDLGAAAIARRQ